MIEIVRGHSEQEEHWLVMGSASVNREVVIRDYMRQFGWECYVPMRYEVKRVRGVQQRKLVPAIRGLIFVKGRPDEIKSYAETAPDKLFLRRSTFSGYRELLTVPDQEMENFIRATEANQEKVSYFAPDEIDLQAGERIRVVGGLYDGVEGVILRVKGKRRKQLVVQVRGVAIASIELMPEMVQLTDVAQGRRSDDRDDHRSKNLEADKKLLFDTAYRLLFIIPDRHRHESEYYLAISELRRVWKRVAPYHGFTAASEGELALAMYLAAVRLEEQVEAAEARLRKAVERLQPTSLLRLRMRFYLGRLSGDDALVSSVLQEVNGWDVRRLTQRQKPIVEEIRKSMMV